MVDEIPGIKVLKDCLCEARQASARADERLSQLLTVRATAIVQKNNVSDLIRVNERAVSPVGASGREAVQALATLVDELTNTFEQARKEALSRKQQLFMLQTAWSTALGGTASLVPLCGICMQRGVDTVCTPCGHTYCQTCAAGIGRQPNASRYTPAAPCHVCRATVQTKQKIFFS